MPLMHVSSKSYEKQLNKELTNSSFCRRPLITLTSSFYKKRERNDSAVIITLVQGTDINRNKIIHEHGRHVNYRIAKEYFFLKT